MRTAGQDGTKSSGLESSNSNPTLTCIQVVQLAFWMVEPFLLPWLPLLPFAIVM